MDDGSIGSIQECEERERGYLLSYDPHFEGMYDQVIREVQYYGKKVLYDGAWRCTEYGKHTVEKLCSQHNVPIASLVAAYKTMDWMPR